MKLRLARPRTSEDTSHEHDLRGIGEQELLLAGFPYCRLVCISRKPLEPQSTELLKKYGLRTLSLDPSTFVIVPERFEAHLHKEQCVSLFVAALDLNLAHNLELTLNLEEVRPFTSLLREAIQNSVPITRDDGQLAVFDLSVPKHTNQFAITDVCVDYLNEAGFEIAPGTHVFGADEQRSLLNRLLKVHSTKQRSAIAT